jgi:HEXXH motif-containing protein
MEIFRLLSTPQEGDFEALAAELAATQFHAFATRAVRVAEMTGHPDDPVLSDVVRRIGERDSTVAYWTPEVGAIFTGLQGTPTDADHRWLQAQTAIAAHLTGVIDGIDLETSVDRSLLVCGDRIEPGAWRIRGDASSLELSPRGRKAGERSPIRFHAVTQSGRRVWLPSEPGARILSAGGHAIRFVGTGWHEIWAEEPIEAAELDASVIEQFTAALELLGRTAPEYRAWVLCLLKEITPIRRPNAHTIASNSSSLRLGGIDIATPATPTETAEMLVHECSHQYLHMAAWIGSLVNADARPHYSPLKRRERPLERILLGYHAFGNALLVYDRFHDHGLGAQLGDRLRTVTAYMDELARPLASEVGLSPLGLEILRPLRTRLETLSRIPSPAAQRSVCAPG